MHAVDRAAHNYPLVLPCLLSMLWSCVSTAAVHLASQQRNGQGLGLLAAVLALMFGTVLAPRRIAQPPIVLFCLHVFCLAYVWTTSSVIVSAFLP